MVTGAVGLVVVTPTEVAAGDELASHLSQIVEVAVMMTVEVERLVSMLVTPPVVWVKVTGQRVVDVVTLGRS